MALVETHTETYAIQSSPEGLGSVLYFVFRGEAKVIRSFRSSFPKSPIISPMKGEEKRLRGLVPWRIPHMINL
jgi:hypothetical protein